MGDDFKICVKWNGKEYPLPGITSEDTVAVLKEIIFKETQVRPERQKLLNLKHKDNKPVDGCKILELNLKSGYKIMMVGSLEKDILQVNTYPQSVSQMDLENYDEELEKFVSSSLHKDKGNERLLVTVCWDDKEYPLFGVYYQDKVADLKKKIFDVTGVLPEKQKLTSLKYKDEIASDHMNLKELNVVPGTKIFMVGSKDLEVENAEDSDTEMSSNSAFMEMNIPKVLSRVKSYKVHILNAPRPGKKLLVLDIDYTLFDHRSTGSCGSDLMRPFLHEFLTDAYKNYDIVIWSATNMTWIAEKMSVLGVATNPNYRIAFYLDSYAMITVHSEKYGFTTIKPLQFIWSQFPYYTPANTIMFDDIRRNFLMNPQNGLKIKPYKHSFVNKHVDEELLHLMRYLRIIVEQDDFGILNHKHWKRYVIANNRLIGKDEQPSTSTSTSSSGDREQ